VSAARAAIGINRSFFPAALGCADTGGRGELRRIVDYGERLFLILLSATFLQAMLANAFVHPYVLLLCVSETLPVLLMIIRRPGEMAMKPYPLILAFIGTAAFSGTDGMPRSLNGKVNVLDTFGAFCGRNSTHRLSSTFSTA